MSPRRVLLVVGDDVVRLDDLREALSVSNFAVHACEDALDALHYLDQVRPAVIVLDLDMPHVSGTVLYEELRGRRQADRVPIVVLADQQTVPDLPGATVLRKPIEPDALVVALESVLVQRDRTRLFSRGQQSVLVSRIAEGGTRERLVVCGPGQLVDIYESHDPIDCTARQSAIERELITDGYQLLASERRAGQERRTQPRDERDRRRPFAIAEEQSAS